MIRVYIKSHFCGFIEVPQAVWPESCELKAFCFCHGEYYNGYSKSKIWLYPLQKPIKSACRNAFLRFDIIQLLYSQVRRLSSGNLKSWALFEISHDFQNRPTVGYCVGRFALVFCRSAVLCLTSLPTLFRQAPQRSRIYNYTPWAFELSARYVHRKYWYLFLNNTYRMI